MSYNIDALGAIKNIAVNDEFVLSDCSTKSLLQVKTLLTNENTLEAPPFIYTLQNICASKEFIIDYTTVSQTVRKDNDDLTDYEVVVLNVIDASPSAENDVTLQNMLEQLVDSTTITRIIIPTDLDLSIPLLAVSLFVPATSCCISIEFQNQKKCESNKYQDSNLTAVIAGLCGSISFSSNWKALSITNLREITRRRCAEIARSYLPQLPNLEIFSITHGTETKRACQDMFDMDQQEAGRIWADNVLAHPNLQVLRCSAGADYWMPVYLLGATGSQGWLTSLAVSWKLTSSDSQKSRTPLTELETSLIAALMLLNTWTEEITFHNLLETEQTAIVGAMLRISGSNRIQDFYEFSNSAGLTVFRRPQGTMQ